MNNLRIKIGNTPMIRLRRFENYIKSKSKIYAKLESFNPFGSIKDRAAFRIINDAIACSKIDGNTCIVEATSGNMGISLAAISAILERSCKIIMPEDASRARKKLIKYYGAELVYCKDIIEANKIARDFSVKNNGTYWCNQFNNLSNVEAHFYTTAPEIEIALKTAPDVVISGIGTGGTIMGISQYFKDRTTEIIGVEPASSPTISKGIAKKHCIPGIGAGFVPPLIDMKSIRTIYWSEDSEAYRMTRIAGALEGISAGISSGATMDVCHQYVMEHNPTDKNIVLIFPDGYERYI